MGQVKVNREELLSKLQSVQPGLASREVIQQSSCYCVTGGYIVTFNEEIACRIPSGLPKDFEGAIQATPLLALLQKLEEEFVTFEINDKELKVTGKRREAGI